MLTAIPTSPTSQTIYSDIRVCIIHIWNGTIAFYKRIYCVHTKTKMWHATINKKRVKWHKLENQNNSWGNVHRVNGHLFGKAIFGEEINNFLGVIVICGWPLQKITNWCWFDWTFACKKTPVKELCHSSFKAHIWGLMVPISMWRCGKWEAGRPAMFFQSPVWTPHPCTQHSRVDSRCWLVLGGNGSELGRAG